MQSFDENTMHSSGLDSISNGLDCLYSPQNSILWPAVTKGEKKWTKKTVDSLNGNLMFTTILENT